MGCALWIWAIAAASVCYKTQEPVWAVVSVISIVGVAVVGRLIER